MKTPFSGECACGAIRYECTAEPAAMVQCHCRDCQRATGGACIYVVVVPANAFNLTRGALRYHLTESAAMGHQRRGFCATCGSPLTAAENREGTTEFVGITVASLDDPSEFRSQMHTWTSDAQPWDHLNPVLPRFEQYPPF
jgi:hypothetical protein